MYLFKTSSGKWVFGKTIKSTCSAGSYRLDPNADFSVVEIYHLQSNSLFFSGAPTVFLKESGTAYADFTEFFTACEDFFFKLDTLSDAELELASTTFYNKTEIDALKTPSNFLEALTALGTTIKATPIGVNINSLMNGTSALVDGAIYLIAFYIPKAITSTGINFVLNTAGNFTADNYNGFGLYSISGGTLTKITETATDGNVWKTTAYTLGSKAWPTPQTLAAGVYFVALHWNASATTTAPSIYTWGTLSSNHALILSNSNKISGYLTSQASLPSSTTGSAQTVNSVIHGVWMY